MKNGLIYGAVVGVIFSILLLVLHRLVPSLFFGPIQSLIMTFTLAIIAMVLACRKEKRELGGTLRFGEGLITTMVCFAVFNFIYTVVMWALINYSASAFELLTETSRSSAEAMLRMANTPEDAIFEQMEQINALTSETKKLGVNLINWAVMILFPGAPIALIIAGIMSRKTNIEKT